MEQWWGSGLGFRYAQGFKLWLQLRFCYNHRHCGKFIAVAETPKTLMLDAAAIFLKQWYVQFVRYTGWYLKFVCLRNNCVQSPNTVFPASLILLYIIKFFDLYVWTDCEQIAFFCIQVHLHVSWPWSCFLCNHLFRSCCCWNC